MGQIYDAWMQHMTSAAANIPGAGETWTGGVPSGPLLPDETLDAEALQQWIAPLITGLLHAGHELAQDVDRLRAEVDELKSRG